MSRYLKCFREVDGYGSKNLYQEVAFEKNFNAYLSRGFIFKYRIVFKIRNHSKFFQGASLGTCRSFIFFSFLDNCVDRYIYVP